MSLLAQIIAGEAQGGNNADSFGVASTIFNRSNLNFNGYGSTPLAQATAASQFSAYPNALGTPTAYQQQLADAAENGTLSQYGNTGNALFYNGPGGSSYNAYNSVPGSSYGQGSNAYSNVYGQPANSSFVLPTLGGSAVTGNSVTMSPDQSDALFASAANQGIGSDTPNLTDSDFAGLTDADVMGGLPNNAASAVGSVNASSLASSLGGAAGAGGIAVNLTDESQLPSSVSGAGTAAKAGLTTAGSDVQTAAGGLAGTAASIINSAEAYTSKAIVVIALVLMGAIFVALGLGLFGKRELAAVT